MCEHIVRMVCGSGDGVCGRGNVVCEHRVMMVCESEDGVCEHGVRMVCVSRVRMVCVRVSMVCVIVGMVCVIVRIVCARAQSEGRGKQTLVFLCIPADLRVIVSSSNTIVSLWYFSHRILIRSGGRPTTCGTG